MPRTETLVPSASQMEVKGAAKPVQYISFKAIVGRNSVFKDLTDENIEELGGVEYRALSALVWIVPVVRIIFIAQPRTILLIICFDSIISVSSPFPSS